jgi:hypothetical protein
MESRIEIEDGVARVVTPIELGEYDNGERWGYNYFEVKVCADAAIKINGAVQ